MKPKKLFLSKITFLALAFFTSGTVLAATSDVAGTWKWTTEGRDGQSSESSLVLKQDGDKVTGLYKSTRGESPIEDGKVSGKEIAFKITREVQQGSFTAHYKGTVEGNTIKGSMAAKFGDRDFEREWVAKREGIDPSGNWAWSMERDNGETMEATLALKLEGENVVGTLEREGSGFSLNVRNGKLSGSTLTFETVFERDGQSMTMKNEAVLKDNSLTGKVSGKTPDGDEFSREWKAKRK